jgi:hypothetical protein
MGKGKLVFKGEKDAKKKKKKTKHSPEVAQAQPFDLSSENSALLNACQGDIYPTNIAQKQIDSSPKIQIGDGLVTSSSIVITGYETSFLKTLNVGDAILVNVELKDGTTREEMRVLTMRLSDTSASISSAFTEDVSRPTSYRYITKPKNTQKEKLEEEKKDKYSKEELNRNAFGTYTSDGSSGKQFVYRERTEHGSYRIKREAVSENVSRTKLLEMRAQKKSDKYC